MPPESSDGMELAPGVWAATDAIRFAFSRSGGPGGQNVNKLNTKAELWVAVDDLRGLTEDAKRRLRTLAGHRLTREDAIHIVAEEQRTQEANRAAALLRLRELLIQAKHRPRRRRPTRPTRTSVERRLETKKLRGQTKRSRRIEAD